MKEVPYNNRSFLGRGWSFPPTFSKLGLASGIEMVENEQDIRESLEVLLNTRLGERTMLPEYGCDLHSYLFDSISTSKMHFLRDIIRRAIITYEPRIELHDVIIDHSKYLDGIIKIKIDYSIETSNTRFNLVFPYYRVEGTSVPTLYQKHVTHEVKSVAND